MTQADTKRMNHWLAGLIGIAVVLVLTSFLGASAHPGIVALVLLAATAAGGFLAARLSGRPGPAWGAAAFGLLLAVAYLVTHSVDARMLPPAYADVIRRIDIPLWLAASLLGSPLLGGRIGEAGARRR